MDDEPQHTVDTLMHRFVRMLEHRVSLQGVHAIARHDEEVVGVADELATLLRRPLRTLPDEPPPRRIGIAMALALHGAPHLSATLPRPRRTGSVALAEPARRPADPPLSLTSEVLEEVLGMATWELDELREEIDRRASKQLKLARTSAWLWSHFHVQDDGPFTLSSVLLPGATDTSSELVMRGSQLYLLLEPPNPIPHQAIFLHWLAPDAEWAPTLTFQARALDPTLKARIARGIGADDEEVEELLGAMIASTPSTDPERFLHLDQWRAHGHAVLADLGTPYGVGRWLTQPLPPDGADWPAWLVANESGALTVTSPLGRVFDALALPRVTAMMRMLYAAMLAQIDRDGRQHPNRVGPEDLVLFDLHRHMRAVLQPLIDWASSPMTHREVAGDLDRSVEEVAALLTEVRQAWLQQMATSWCGPPGSRTPSIQTLLIQHAIALHQSLRRLMRRQADPRADHCDVLLQFCAHYLREARLERLWTAHLSDCADELDEGPPLPPPEDVAGHWFWRTWTRLLDGAELLMPEPEDIDEAEPEFEDTDAPHFEL